MIPQQWLRTILDGLSLFSVMKRYNRISREEYRVLYQLCTVFLFLTTRVLEKKRWG